MARTTLHKQYGSKEETRGAALFVVGGGARDLAFVAVLSRGAQVQFSLRW